MEKQGIQTARKLLFQQQVAVNKDKLSALYAKAVGMVQVAAAGTKESVFALLKQKSPSLQFKNLENLDEENLRQILTETEILELIEQMEQGDKNDAPACFKGQGVIRLLQHRQSCRYFVDGPDHFL